MVRLARIVLMILLTTATLVSAADPKIELRTVKYDDLMKEVRSHKGKVVVVDIWAQWCVPCKKEFPGLVRLRELYGKDDFVAISVTIDDPKDTEARGSCVAFLEKVKAVEVINLNLDEMPVVWQSKFRIEVVPAVFVFDQRNRIALKLPTSEQRVDYRVIEEKVKELLKK